jgi:hypothetical protein
MGTGRELEIISDEIVAKVQRPMRHDKHTHADRERMYFDAMMRVLDRELPGYAE